MSDKSVLEELIALRQLEAYKELTKKPDEKKPTKWWVLNPIKLWIIGILLYPIIGPMYMKLILALWK